MWRYLKREISYLFFMVSFICLLSCGGNDVKFDADRELIDGARLGDVARIKIALLQGASVEAKDECGNPAIIVAAHNRHLDVIKYMIGTHCFDLNVKSYSGESLIGALASIADLEVMRMVLDQGVSPNSMNSAYGQAPIHVAASDGSKELVLMLVEYGADFSVADCDGCLPIHYASASGKSDIVQYFIDLGVSCDSADLDGNSVLHYAVHGNAEDVVRCLIANGVKTDTNNCDGETPIDLTTNRTILDLLVKANVNLNK
jgi:ankyrin repeat protein